MGITLTSDEYYARARWVRICMELLVLKDDFRVAREIAGAEPRKHKRW